MERADLRDPQGIIDAVLSKFTECCFVHLVGLNEVNELRLSKIDRPIATQSMHIVTFVPSGWRWEMGTRNIRLILCP